MNRSAHVFVAVCALVPMVASAAAGDVPPKLRTFFSTYCSQCHGAETEEADFRVDTMLKVSATAVDAEYWQLVLDNLNLGEVPPEGENQPSDAERESVTEWIEGELRRARKALVGNTAEVVLRRLNRTDYQYTIDDLFDVRGDFTSGFPADARAEGLDNNGAALMLSSEQITQYMQAAAAEEHRRLRLAAKRNKVVRPGKRFA
jgi:hypothetical protein